MIHERLTYYIEYKGFTKNEFCKNYNFNYDSFVNTAAGKLPLGMKVLKQIKEALPDLNTEWLLFNNGEMEITLSDRLNEPVEIYNKKSSNHLDKMNLLLQDSLKDKNKIIEGLEFKISALENQIKEKSTEEIAIKSDMDKKHEVSDSK